MTNEEQELKVKGFDIETELMYFVKAEDIWQTQIQSILYNSNSKRWVLFWWKPFKKEETLTDIGGDEFGEIVQAHKNTLSPDTRKESPYITTDEWSEAKGDKDLWKNWSHIKPSDASGEERIIAIYRDGNLVDQININTDHGNYIGLIPVVGHSDLYKFIDQKPPYYRLIPRK